LSSAAYRLVLLLAVSGAALYAAAQGTGTPGRTTVPGESNLFRSLNTGVTFTAVHDSSIGWYNMVTPALSYTVSPRYAADASLSIYPYRLSQNQAPAAASTPISTQTLVTNLGDLGDVLVSLHAYVNPRGLQNTLTASMTLPTGDTGTGLGTGHVTFDLRDHIESYVRQTGFLLDLGTGDSSGLFNRLVANESTTLGPIAHFQTGVILWLPGRRYIQSVAYEQLPLGDQKLYTIIPRPGAPPLTVVAGRRVSEDNGFTTSVGVPLTANLTLSSDYNRSLRLHLDTASIGITWVLRGTPIKRRPSLIDRAIREAEGANR
jgi:hypothetical protein